MPSLITFDDGVAVAPPELWQPATASATRPETATTADVVDYLNGTRRGPAQLDRGTSPPVIGRSRRLWFSRRLVVSAPSGPAAGSRPYLPAAAGSLAASTRVPGRPWRPARSQC